ncbi:AAA family ATPase [Runella sp. CRIBMP]|uniref:ATP-binding protein n=1 Tax=Runella sp. CRIBMP TaxID=2683261 RepID=UPI0014135139|nr:ATP-binding protein [Runella sp. CRIBMP]NBB23024.1 AAA family ATPase [Runella sp. CRIBMP]
MEVLRNITPLLNEYLTIFPAVGIVGPRQVGKTTLAKSLAKHQSVHYLDLETAADRQKMTDPSLYLEQYLDKLVIFDEIQQMPELFAELRGLIDRDRRAGRFLLLGSASPELVRRSADSLAGRIGYIELTPLLLGEVDNSEPMKLWSRGGFPLAFLTPSDRSSMIWRKNFIRTYIEKDLAMLGLSAESRTIERFWRMLASSHANLWNAESIARSMGLTAPTVNRYLDFMEGAFLVRRLMPYSVNIQKRLVKSPKIYLRDSGILHAFKDLNSVESLLGDPQVGASWEGFVIEQIIDALSGDLQPYFYRTHQGTECDLVLEKNGHIKAAIEIKLSSAPTVEKGFRVAMEDLKAEKVFVIGRVKESYPFQENGWVVSLETFLQQFLPQIT